MALLKIKHSTTYHYNQPVFLKPHVVRLRPRCDGWQKLHHYQLDVSPTPIGRSEIVDLDGNATVNLWFDRPTEKLQITSISEVETLQQNPFVYLLEPWAMQLPFDYPSSLRSQLSPYFHPLGILPTTGDPVAAELGEEIAYRVHGKPIDFLHQLTQEIYRNCKYVVRPHGDPQSPSMTWKKREGSCRDFAVLFVAACRVVGLAARFVSGYQEGDPDSEERDLHAWVEAYLPGAGWRGYDPTHGLAVANGHISVAASVYPSYAAPVEGGVIPVTPPLAGGKPLESQMEFHISIDR
ncbi:transglutaminase family protein [Baaleninema sp.]|uniref:transglutaminase family protein n=1 Tax=Baaleninema sp. TaxID=3101197 RepID=UPI003CFCD9C6